MSENLESWAQCEIGEVAQVVGGGTPPSKDPTNFTTEGGIPWITPADLSGYKEAYISRGVRNLSEKGFRVSSASKLPPGSVLFSSRAPVGYVAIAANELTTSQGFKSFVLQEGLDSRFVYFYLRHIRPVAEAMATGTTFKELSGANAARLPLLVAPTNEQQRIADKLDTLLARVDACRARLERVPLILKRFRQAVLAAATSGRLTEGHEADQSEHPLLSEVIERLKTGPFGSALHKYDYVTYGIPIVNPMHINGGRITPTHDMTLTREKADELKEFRLVRGDVVLARRGVMGRCAVVGSEQEGWLCGSGSMLLHPTNRVLPEYLQIFLSSPDIVEALEADSVGSTMSNLNQGILLGLRIRVPDIRVQHEIVRRVEALFTYTDHVEARYQAARAQVERLTPSLLAKAFRGELMPQDPNDEPAAVLLARIRAARASAAVQQKPSRRSRTMERKTPTRKIPAGSAGIVHALQEAKRELSGKDLFAAAGYPPDADAESVEAFFVAVRDALKKEQITSTPRLSYSQGIASS